MKPIQIFFLIDQQLFFSDMKKIKSILLAYRIFYYN